MRIENSTFLITGGGSKLGAACVRLLAGAVPWRQGRACTWQERAA